MAGTRPATGFVHRTRAPARGRPGKPRRVPLAHRHCPPQNSRCAGLARASTSFCCAEFVAGEKTWMPTDRVPPDRVRGQARAAPGLKAHGTRPATGYFSAAVPTGQAGQAGQSSGLKARGTSEVLISLNSFPVGFSARFLQPDEWNGLRGTGLPGTPKRDRIPPTISIANSIVIQLSELSGSDPCHDTVPRNIAYLLRRMSR
jgi:hypothetical protein